MIKRVYFIVYLAIVTLILFELTIAFFLHNSRFIPQVLLNPIRGVYFLTRTLPQFDSQCSEYDENLFYKLKPGKCSHVTTEFSKIMSIGPHGFRGEKNINYYKIICAGDSFTMGWGVSDQETFCHIIDGLNTGVPSYGTVRELLSIQNLDVNKNANGITIVIQYCSNDFDENLHFLKWKSASSSQDTYNQAVAENKENIKYYPFKYFFSYARNLEKLSVLKNYYQIDDRNYLKEASVFLRVVSKFDSLDKDRILVFDAPINRQINNRFAEEVDKLLDTENFRFLKNRVITVKMPENMDQNMFFVLDEHYSPYGHRKIAEMLLPILNSASSF